MTKGPEQLKFEQAVGEKGSARSQSVDLLVAKQRWQQMAQVLHDSADDLELRAYSAPAVSDQTGTAMQNAFLKTAAAMRERAGKLKDGGEALGAAAATLHSAEQAKSQLRELHDPGTWSGGTPVTDQELKAKSDHDTAVSTYNADKKHNETIAAQHNQAMDAQNEQSTAVMKRVYGYQDPAPDPGTYGSGSASAPGTPGSTSSGAPSGGTTTHGGTSTGSYPGGGTHHGTGGTPTGGGHHTGNPTGTPQGDIGAPAADAGSAIGGSSFTPATPTQATPGSVGTSFGGVGATLGAGIVGGAGGMLGGVRGGSALPSTSASSTAGARSIGTSSRSGGASTLGRSSATRAGGMPGEEEAAAQRTGTSGRAGAGAGAGRAGGGRGAAGRSGRGGAGGQGTRGRKKSGHATLDHMVIEEDWLDDEGHSPAVLD